MADVERQKRFFLAILLLFAFFFVVGYTSRLLKKNQMEQEVRHWQERIIQAQQKSVALQAELAYVRSEAYVHERARETLGLVQPNDTLLVEVKQASPPGAEPGVTALSALAPVELTASEPANWQQWLELFLPVAAAKRVESMP